METCRQLLALLLMQSISAEFAYDFNSTALDCGIRRMILSRANNLFPHKARETFDSLELERLCGDGPPTRKNHVAPSFDLAPSGTLQFFVDAEDGNDASQGSTTDPFATVYRALNAAREAERTEGQEKTIVLKAGIHFLNETMALTTADSGLTITNAPGEEAWLSGGKLVPTTTPWKPSSKEANIWEADLSTLGLDDVPGLYSLAPHRRYIRARYPNADAETTQWGYASAGRYNFSLPSGSVEEWWKPAKGKVPSMRSTDFSKAGNPSGVVKNDSTMAEYNMWGTGDGGVCADVWTGTSYWCSGQY
jgi:hypothetical protein